MPAKSQVLEVDGVVDGGPMSQNGFINQCDDVSIKPLNGTPPFILTISPPNHPTYNLTSYTMDPIVWTVSLSRAMPFFLSLVSSEGLIWSNGPMGVGRSNVDACLAPDTLLKSKAHAVAAGAGIGGLFGGFFLVGTVLLVKRYWPRQIQPHPDSLVTPWFDRPRPNRLDSRSAMDISTFGGGSPGSVTVQPTPISAYPKRTASGSQVFVRHQDGGRLVNSGPMMHSALEMTRETTEPGEMEMEGEPEVVELPPTYFGGPEDENGAGGSRTRVLPEKPRALPRLEV